MRTGYSYTSLIVLIAASIVSVVLGSIHAFSVFLEPLENLFFEPRSNVSFTYSLALLSLTIAVLLGPRIFGRWQAAPFILFVCILAACGALFAAMAGSLVYVWLGYSLIFGTANGLGYGYGLQIAAQVYPGREGLAMGIVTASYAFGAVLSPIFFQMAVDAGGFALAMKVLASVLLGTGLLSAVLMQIAGAKFKTGKNRLMERPLPAHSIQLLWLGYFTGALAGLMVIGHAAAIATSVKPGMDAWVAPIFIAACNLLGSLVAGRLADRISLGLLLGSLALLTSATLVVLVVLDQATVLLGALGLVGFAYGGTIAVYPAAIVKLFGIQVSASVYGRVFTAWGCAGLTGPWFAGFLFDWKGDYQLALLVGAVIALISVACVTVLFQFGRVRNG